MPKLICISAMIFMSAAAHGSPHKPASDSEVIETLPRIFFAAPVTTRAVTNSAADAAKLAQTQIAAYRAESDPRRLGYAQAFLQPWWNETHAPEEILIARATIKQSLHDFNGAVQDMDLALKENPRNPQTLLLRATVLQVQGKFAEARSTATRLLTLAPQHIAVTVIASVASLNGEARKSYDLLASVAANSSTVPADQKVWMLTTLAEMAVRLGEFKQAERYFTEALSVSSNDTYALAAFSDFLVSQGQPERAFELVKDFGRIDSLLLRRALALRALSKTHPELKADVDELQLRFDASKLRGDFMHQREEARFLLSLLDQPSAALKVARLNWNVQREPADVRIYLEAAVAAHDKPAASDLLKWIHETRMEDKALEGLEAKLQ